MISCEVSGGLGNQFFRYAYARALQEKRKKQGLDDELAINYGAIEDHGFVGDLSDFNIVSHEAYNCRRLLLIKGSWLQKIVYAIFTRFGIFSRIYRNKSRSLSRVGIVISENPDNEVIFTPPYSRNQIFTIGSFENESYFSEIAEKLKLEFTPKHDILPQNSKLYDVIKQSNSVCLAVRRGDFMKEEFKKTFYVCDLTYFKNAISYIKKHVTNPTFIVFSNDIGWVKENMEIDGDVYYESGHDPVWETYRLMYSCKHFIISNSTLHWWAQYKGNYSGKIVVAPERWYNAPGWERHLLLDSFVKLPTGISNPYASNWEVR